VATACPTVHWLDGGELVAAAHHLVPAHAPGEPCFVLLGKLITLVPLGSIGFRLSVLSALVGAAAAFVAGRLVLGWVREVAADLGPVLHIAVSVLVVLASFLGYPTWIQSVRAEVYALHLLLALAGTITLVAAGAGSSGFDARWTGVSGLLWGLDLAVHPLLAGLAFLSAVVIVLARRLEWTPWAWLTGVVGGLAGCSTVLLIPVRAFRHPGYGWGDGRTYAGFLDTILARSFQHNFSPLTGDLLGHNAGVVWRLALDYLGPVGLVLAGVGVIRLLLSGRYRDALVPVVFVGFGLLSVVPQNKVYGENPDLLGYLALPMLVMWATAGVGAAALSLWVRRLRGAAWTGGLALAVGFIPVLFLSLGPSDRSGDYQARELGMTAFQGLPPGALLVVSGNDTTFVTQYLQEVEHVRPDVMVLPRSLLTHPWFRARTGRGDAWLHRALGPAGDFAREVDRPVRVEFRDQDVVSAAMLCPVPAPGWGFYDVRPCFEEERKEPVRLQGLLFSGDRTGSQHARLLGANAALYLIDYYRALGLTARAEWVEERLKREVPGLVLPGAVTVRTGGEEAP